MWVGLVEKRGLMYHLRHQELPKYSLQLGPIEDFSGACIPHTGREKLS